MNRREFLRRATVAAVGAAGIGAATATVGRRRVAQRQAPAYGTSLGPAAAVRRSDTRKVRVGSIQPAWQRQTWPREGVPGPELVRRNIEENLSLACRLLAQAGELGCDLAVYPEDVQAIGCYLYFADLDLFASCVETVPGPTSERIGAVAKRFGMHVVYTQDERVGETICNAAVLVGRDGQVIGKYHKVQLPGAERWMVAHGDSFPVFETDFGTVGMMVCYDLDFPEVARCLALNGAEMLCCPTMGTSAAWEPKENGLMRVRMRAIDNFVPTVVSSCRADSVIVDSSGAVLAMARPNTEDVIHADIDLDATLIDRGDSMTITGLSDVKARLLQERLPDVYAPLTAPQPPVLGRYRDKALLSPPVSRKSWIGFLQERLQRPGG